MEASTPNDHTALLNSRVRVPEHVVFRAFATETVVLNLQSGVYHGVNQTGGRMLELLQEIGSVREVADRLAEEYAVPQETLENDLCELCVDMMDRGLIELNGSD